MDAAVCPHLATPGTGDSNSNTPYSNIKNHSGFMTGKCIQVAVSQALLSINSRRNHSE